VALTDEAIEKIKVMILSELRLLGVPAGEAARLTALPLPDTGAW
jgi:hypothetical protein